MCYIEGFQYVLRKVMFDSVNDASCVRRLCGDINLFDLKGGGVKFGITKFVKGYSIQT